MDAVHHGKIVETGSKAVSQHKYFYVRNRNIDIYEEYV